MKILSIAPEIVLASTATMLAAAVALDWNTIILALIGLVGAWVSMKVATLAAAAKEAKLVTDETAKTMDKIHTSVNSKETVTAKRIDELNDTVLKLSETIKTLEENKRGAELAKAVASVPAGLVVLPIAAPIPVTAAPAKPVEGRLEGAISELTEAAKDTVTSAEKTVSHAEKVPNAPGPH